MDTNGHQNNSRLQKKGSFQWRIGGIVVVLLFLGIAIGWLGRGYGPGPTQGTAGNVTQSAPCTRLPGYQFINPLLFCDSNPQPAPAFLPLADKLKQYLFDAENGSGTVASASVYFRDLSLSRWFGINETQAYDPASMLKIPLMIAYYKESESNPELFSKKLMYLGEPQNGKGIDFYTLTAGQSYTVKELIDAMMIRSDNGAKDLLFENMDIATQNTVFSDLGMQSPKDPNSRYVISPKTFASFYRVLYNATYLNRPDSEDALKLLNGSEFQDGLVAGVPTSTVVAHKFGQYGSTDGGGAAWELHDCGIVYHPARPYILCVMTSGANLGALKVSIQGISRLVYQAADQGFQ